MTDYTVIDYIILNRKGSFMGAVETEAEANEIVAKAAKRGWAWTVKRREIEYTTLTWWQLAGHNEDPTAKVYGTVFE